MVRVRRVLLIAVLALLVAPVARAVPLPTRLAQALAVPGNSPAASGVIAIELPSGAPVFERNPDASLVPASNEKLVVTYAALVELGSTYRFRTQVLSSGHQTGTVWHGDVYLKGYGDPTLRSIQLVRLANQLRKDGIRRIDGRVLGDESWFDRVRTAPGWKPSFYLEESPPISALAVNHAVYQNHVALQPALAAAGTFRRVLRSRHIAVGRATVGTAPKTAYMLAQIESEPLPQVLVGLDHESDNFAAELLLKDLGAEAGEGGTTADGAAVVLRVLRDAGVPLAGVRIIDGSGLSQSDRVTPRALATLLRLAWTDPALRRAFMPALPVAGVSGTLEDRMQRRPARGVVHAKTGTTDRASSLSGYVGNRYVFSILQNGRPVSPWAAREAQDRFATALASTL
jgi:D-alanyl-D-alanine carboxypeptidase/D-alanyl-D-alanine-endopeptidase (penicillin-binding protein 4)